MMALAKSLGAAQAPPLKVVRIDGPLAVRASLKLGGSSPRELDVRYKFNAMLRSTSKAQERVLVLREARPRRFNFDSGLVLGREGARALEEILEKKRVSFAKTFCKALKAAAEILGFTPSITAMERSILQGNHLEYSFPDVSLETASLDSRSLEVIQARQSAQQELDKVRELLYDVNEALRLLSQMSVHADKKVSSIRKELSQGGHLERDPVHEKAEYDAQVQEVYKKYGLSPDGFDTLPSAFRVPVIQEAVNGVQVHYKSGLRLPWVLPKSQPVPWEIEYLLKFLISNNWELVDYAPAEAVTPTGRPLPLPVEVATSLEQHVANRAERLGGKSATKDSIKWPIPLREAQAWRWLIISWNWFHQSKAPGALGREALVSLPKKLGWAASAPRSGSQSKISSLEKKLDEALTKAVQQREEIPPASSSKLGGEGEERIRTLESQVQALLAQLGSARAEHSSDSAEESSEDEGTEMPEAGPPTFSFPATRLVLYPSDPRGPDLPQEDELLVVYIRNGVEYHTFLKVPTSEDKPAPPPEKGGSDLVPCSNCPAKVKTANILAHIKVCPGKAAESSPERKPRSKEKEKAGKRPPTPGPDKRKVDPLERPDPLHASSQKGKKFSDLPEATQTVLRTHFKVERMDSCDFDALSSFERKSFLKANKVPRWATVLVLRDITNLPKVVSGEINSDNASDWVSRQGSRKRGSRSQVTEAVEAWKKVKSRFQGTALLARPRSQKEKSLLKELNHLRSRYGKLDVFPSPKSASSTPKTRGRSSSRGSSGLDFDQLIKMMLVRSMSRG
jgi:hypothetical protein